MYDILFSGRDTGENPVRQILNNLVHLAKATALPEKCVPTLTYQSSLFKSIIQYDPLMNSVIFWGRNEQWEPLLTSQFNSPLMGIKLRSR
jgi:hypothetical protein